jgi:hypothetical protein
VTGTTGPTGPTGVTGATGPTGVTGFLQAFSTGTVGPAFSSDTYLVGSAINLGANPPKAGATYKLTVQVSKTNAGTATPILTVRFGAGGTTADTAVLTFTFGAGTAVADTGIFDVTCHFRTVGAAAVLVGVAELRHQLSATGLTNTGTAGNPIVPVVSAGFDSTPANRILGASLNGGTSAAWTCTLVEAQWSNP